jgi:hypothetical protein
MINLLEPSGPVQACKGIALPFTNMIKEIHFIPYYCVWKNNPSVIDLEITGVYDPSFISY